MVVFGCDGRGNAGFIDAGRATDLVVQLPEVKTWSNWIRTTTGGRVAGICMLDNKFPDNRLGRDVWRIGFFEDHPGKTVKWTTFLVDVRTGEIFIEDSADLSVKSLDQWRAAGGRGPMPRE